MAAKNTTAHFTCPKCNALYQVVKADAGPETTDREIRTVACPRRDIRLQVFPIAQSNHQSKMATPPPPVRAYLKNHARRITANIAKLPGCWKRRSLLMNANAARISYAPAVGPVVPTGNQIRTYW